MRCNGNMKTWNCRGTVAASRKLFRLGDEKKNFCVATWPNSTEDDFTSLVLGMLLMTSLFFSQLSSHRRWEKKAVPWNIYVTLSSCAAVFVGKNRAWEEQMKRTIKKLLSKHSNNLFLYSPQMFALSLSTHSFQVLSALLLFLSSLTKPDSTSFNPANETMLCGEIFSFAEALSWLHSYFSIPRTRVLAGVSSHFN